MVTRTLTVTERFPNSSTKVSSFLLDVNEPPDVSVPIILSSNTASVLENTAFSLTLAANEPVTWTKLAGFDAALFTLTANTLTLAAKDFENPEDADKNNVYIVQVTATDTAGNPTTQTIQVSVTNVLEGATPSFSTTAGSAYSADPASKVVLDLPALAEGESRSYVATTGPQFTINSAGKLIRGIDSFASGMATGRIIRTRGTETIPDVNVTITLSQPAPAAGLQISSNLTRMNYTADTTTAGNEAREQRTVAYLGRQNLSEIWLVFCNWWLDFGAGGNETSTGNPVTLSMALEYNGVTVVAPNASLTTPAIVADGATFFAGPFKPEDFGVAEFVAQSVIYPRIRTVVKVGEKIPRTGQYTSVSPCSRKWRAAGDASQLARTGAFTDAVNTNPGPAANMVMGKPVAYEVAGLWLGGSLGEGNVDTFQILVGAGYPDRAFNDVGGKKVPLAHAGRHAGTLVRLTLPGQTRRLDFVRYASHVFIEFGVIDLLGGVNVHNNFENTYRTVCRSIQDINPNVSIVAVTVAPRTQSSDKFMTANGQISQANWDSLAIKTINSDLQDIFLVEGLVDYVFDPNKFWGQDGDSLKWLTNGTAYYPIPAYGEGIGSVATTGTGTISTATTDAIVTGVGTTFTTQVSVGQHIYRSTNYVGRVKSIESDTSLTLEINAIVALTAQAFVIAERQNGTHPSPAMNILAGTGLSNLVATFTNNVAASSTVGMPMGFVPALPSPT